MRPRKSRGLNDYEGLHRTTGTAYWWFKDGKLRESARPLLRELFLEDVLVDGETACWLWKGRLTWQGYGQTSLLGGARMAHRVAYALFTGEIPDGAHVCHQCDNPPCVNPSHLWLGSHTDNMHDKLVKGRHRAGHNTGNNPFTHCPQGHEYSAANTYLYHGRRYCRTCHKQYAQNYQARDASPTLRTHCGNGHELTAANTYLFRGHQQCRECHKKLSIEWYYRNKDAVKGIGACLE